MRRGDRTGKAAKIARRSLLLAAATLPGMALAQEHPAKPFSLSYHSPPALQPTGWRESSRPLSGTG